MNYTVSQKQAVFPEPQHKPRVSLFVEGEERYYKCTDGGLTQWGNSQLEAFNNLKSCREIELVNN